jgi:hypothetical protein
MVVLGAGPAHAQVRVPRVEFGGNLGGFVAPDAGGFLPGTRVGVAITNRFAVESTFELNDWRRTPSGSHQSWLYSIQMKQMVRPGKQFGDGLFATYGGGGQIYHSHTNAQHFTSNGRTFDFPAASYTDMSRPFFAAFGVAAQQTVAKYLAIRGDAQMIVIPEAMAFGGVGGRFSAGVSIPIGGYKR